jgi:hypothetical protein
MWIKSTQARPYSNEHCEDGKNKTSSSVGEQPNSMIVEKSPFQSLIRDCERNYTVDNRPAALKE